MALAPNSETSGLQISCSALFQRQGSDGPLRQEPTHGWLFFFGKRLLSGLDDPPERWQRIQQQLAVPAGDDAPVQNRDPPGILLGPQQPPHRLDQLHRRVRHGDLHERVASPLGDPLRQAGLDRIIRYRKRQPGDDHMLEVLAGQVDPLGKAGHAEQHAGPPLVHPVRSAGARLPPWPCHPG